MRIKRFENSVFSSNSYVIDDGKGAVIFDIGDTAPIFEYLQNSDLTPTALFITHTHYDHIYGIRDFMTKFPAVSIYTSEFGKEAFKKPNWNFSRYHEDEISIDSVAIKVLEDGETLRIFDDTDLQAIATPGHDKSCLSYR
ncbi:MAG: MBL fold metallo-hydrolase, partial [Muribaculaceae bacterium]|nr:MBL fold metallo-hydrolase [Muribaculaceae bacterium]